MSRLITAVFVSFELPYMLRLMNMLTLESTDSNNMLLIVFSSPHDPHQNEKKCSLTIP